MSSSPTHPKWNVPTRAVRASSEETRRAILTAALEIFSDRGFAATTTRTIAAAANIEQGHMAYYFPTKEGLWRETVSCFNAEFEEIVRHAPTDETPREEMLQRGRDILRRLMLFFHRNRMLSAIINQEFSLTSTRHEWLINELAAPVWASLRPLFTALAKDRHPTALPSHLYYQFLGGAMLFFGVSEGVRRGTDLDMTNDAAEAFITLHLDTFFGPSASLPPNMTFRETCAGG